LGQIKPKVPIQDRFYKYKTKNKLITMPELPQIAVIACGGFLKQIL